MSKQKRMMPTMAEIRAHWSGWVQETMGDEDESPVKLENGRTAGLCYACGMYQPDCERAHIVARVNGGTDTVENLHPLCPPCHKASEDREGDDYWAWLQSWTWLEAALARAFWANPRGAAEVVARALLTPDRDVDQFAAWVRSLRSDNRSNAERTRAALAARKAAGMRMGAPVRLPEDVRQRIVSMRNSGMTLQAIVDVLTDENVPTARGGMWRHTTIVRVIESVRLDAEAAKQIEVDA